MKLIAVGKRGITETTSDTSTVALAYAGPPLAKLQDNFDSNDSLVYFTNLTWGRTTIKAYSAPNSITDSPIGVYKGNTTNSIYFPFTVITNSTSNLSFQHIALIDTTVNGSLNLPDLGIVSISKDFGQSWYDLIWVNKASSPKFKDPIDSSNWVVGYKSLNNYIGDTIMLRFTMMSNNFKNDDGWYIDNLSIDNIVDVPDTKPELGNIVANIYPNPANGIVTFQVGVPESGETVIRLYDYIGNMTKEIKNDIYPAGMQTFTVDLSGIAEGMYFCRITNSGATKTVPVIIQR